MEKGNFPCLLLLYLQRAFAVQAFNFELDMLNSVSLELRIPM